MKTVSPWDQAGRDVEREEDVKAITDLLKIFECEHYLLLSSIVDLPARVQDLKEPNDLRCAHAYGTLCSYGNSPVRDYKDLRRFTLLNHLDHT